MADRYARLRASLPPTYVRFIEAHNGWEGELPNGQGFVVIWNRETIQDQYDAYEMGEFLDDRWFPFGSDAGDEMLCFDLRSQSDSVYSLPFIGMSAEAALLRFDSFVTLEAAIRTAQ